MADHGAGIGGSGRDSILDFQVDMDDGDLITGIYSCEERIASCTEGKSSSGGHGG
jgi:hypothetical protein